MTLLIDVRTAEEYAERHAAHALHLPLDDILAGRVGLLGATDKHTRLELYCRSGGRSEKARQALVAMGFLDVVNLGGLDDVEKSPVPERSVLTYLKKLWNR